MKVNYEIVGEGFPIVMLHGNGENHHEFDQLVEDLKDYQCILIDSSYDGQISYQKLCDDVVEVVDALGLETYDVIGFSDGGIIALMLAMQQDKVSHIITLGANTNPHMIKTFFYIQSILRLVCLIPFCLYQKNARRSFKLTKMMLTEPHFTYDSLKEVKIPALIMAGEYDLIKESDTKNIAEALPYSVLKIIPHGNHFLLRDFYKQTYKEIRLFLDICHKED
ncbi:MAG: alpha/beta hydrolase [Erysipelotrichaceae bacterium]|nr:alpha/beta hydrolase [Erysipelotrichaceae bacterium]